MSKDSVTIQPMYGFVDTACTTTDRQLQARVSTHSDTHPHSLKDMLVMHAHRPAATAAAAAVVAAAAAAVAAVVGSLVVETLPKGLCEPR